MPTSLSLFDLTPGKVLLDRYKVRGPHRENGMSVAFHVEDREDGSRLELQAFPGSLFEDVDQASAFATQLRGWAQIESDAILALRDVQLLDDGAVLVVTDFPRGVSLRTWRGEHGRMESGAAVKLAVSLLGGLVEAHEAGLIHGDIKPEATWFRTEDGSGTLVDCGVTPGLWAAKHLGSRTALIGTPFYAPLEQFGGDSPDELSDIYNLATVMFELLTGVLPWSGKSYIEVFQSKMQPEPPRMRDLAPEVEIDPDLEAVIARALKGKRKERHASARAFRERLQALELD